MQSKKQTSSGKAKYYCDSMPLSKATITDQGFLKAEAILTKAGVFPYYLDGKKVNVFRSHSDLFNDKTIESLKMLPITNGHPRTMTSFVNNRNAKRYTVGYIGENITDDGDGSVRASVIITDSETIDEIKSGKKQLSLGFKADDVKGRGVFDGVPYEMRHINIIGNHVALCEQGRLGEEASLILDSADSDGKILDVNNANGGGMSQQKTVMIDGLEYSAAPEVINYLQKTKESLEEAKKQLDENKLFCDEKDVKLQALDKTLEEFSKRDIESEIIQATNERLGLFKEAQTLWCDSIDEQTVKLSNHELKRKLLLRDFPEAKDWGKDKVDAGYKTAIEIKKKYNSMHNLGTQKVQLAGGASMQQRNSNGSRSITPFEKMMGGKE
jgi:hypothetical protein